MEDSFGSSSLTPLLENERKSGREMREETITPSNKEVEEDPDICSFKEMGTEEDASPIEQVAQIDALPIGRFMAAILPETKFKIPGTKLKFSLNPGPFNVKEHALITSFSNVGASSASAIHIVNIVKVFYKRNLDLYLGLLIVLTSQVTV